MDVTKQRGWIEVICGSMFSGKSEELIRRIHRAQYGKLTVQTFKPLIDNRYSEAEVISHNGISVMADPVEMSAEILENLSPAADVVAIDEIQFFDEGIVDVAEALADRGFRVMAAGLDLDFRGEPFEPMPELMARAETVTKLQAICVVCGTAASRTQRLINGKPARYDEPTIMVGASESYEARCRYCHEVPGKADASQMNAVSETLS